MAKQNFEQPLDGGNLRAQRMTAEESRAVIDLWQQEQTELVGLTDKPAVPDVAEGLDITVEDVQRLLSEVRSRRIETERIIALEQEIVNRRLAAGKCQLAEIQRQRADLRREQAEAQASLPPMPVPKQNEPNEILCGFLPGFVAIVFSVGMALLLTVLAHPASSVIP